VGSDDVWVDFMMWHLTKKQKNRAGCRAGFTLLEIAIVLAVIGLLIGGIMAGNELYRSSQLQSIVTDIDRFKKAGVEFKLKYGGIPGDLIDATRYWPESASCASNLRCDSHDTCPPGTCNGNGNGQLDMLPSTEAFRAWQHLSLSGIIPGNYTGHSGTLPGGAYGDFILDVNAPRSRISQIGYNVYWWQSSALSYIRPVYGNVLTIGKELRGYESYNTNAFTPAEAWSIDKKIDDGMPGLGLLGPRPEAQNPLCVSGLRGQEAAARYRMDITSRTCALMYSNIF
jgi:prepilin-type N-terminal cleavage/methylation domain-containing protein